MRVIFGFGALLAIATGCMLGPTNGTTVAGPVVGTTLSYWGYYNQPGRPVELQVLADPDNPGGVGGDPGVDSNWVTVATTTTSTTPFVWHDPSSPIYAWSVSAAAVPSATAPLDKRWAPGGLQRVR